MNWQLFGFFIWVIGFLYSIIRIEGYFIYKSIEKFKELKEIYGDLQINKKELNNYINRKD